MKFTKYNSIENSYREKFINNIIEYGLAGGDWVVEEKVHGANFSIWYDGSEMKCAKRSSFVVWDSNFNNFQEVVKPLEDGIKAIYAQTNAKEIALFGEIAGGNYPNVKAQSPYAKSIQKGIFYNPDNFFYGFDIKVDGVFLPVDLVNGLFEQYNFIYAKTLFKGVLEECLEYNNEYNSTIPAMFDLPVLDENICEGNVIKPIQPAFFHCGSRVIIKNKNEKWSEKANKSKNKVKREPVQLSEDGQALLDELLTYVTENRLKNVLSKIGEITEKDFGKIMGLTAKDTLEDFNKDFGEQFNALEKPERKVIQGQMNRAITNLIRPNFLNIIYGEF